MSKQIKTIFRVVPRCTIPAMDRTYIFHNQIYDTLVEAEKVSNELMESRVGGEFIDVIITHLDVNSVPMY